MEIRLVGDVSARPTTPEASPHRRLRGAQQRLVFAMLTVERKHGVPREVLAEALWPDGLPKTWPSALRGIVSRLRAFVTPMLGSEADPLPTRAGRYQLHLPDDVVVDVELAEWSVAVAQAALVAGDPKEARQTAENALRCLRQPFLAGHDGAWVAIRRAHLVDLLVAGLEVVSRAATAVHDGLGALVAANEAVTRAPLRESAHRCLMAAHVAAGNRAEALRVYQRLRRTLAEELGVDPAPETESSYLDLLGPRPSLPHAVVAHAHPPTVPLPGSNGERVEGEAALAVLTRAWARAAAGERRLVVVTGPAGVGKSRLVAEAARRATAAAGLVLVGEAGPAAPGPYQPLVEALDAYAAVAVESGAFDDGVRAELQRVLPSLSRPAPPAPPADEARFFDAMVEVVVAATTDRPVLLVLDQLQQGDESLGRLLRHVLRRTVARRLLLVVVSSSPEGSAGVPVPELLADLAQASWCDRIELAAPGDDGLPDEPDVPRETDRQRTVADAPSGLPSPSAPRPVPGRLPTYLTSFVGRDEACEHVVAALRHNHVVTLTGEGGIGKTRLAVEAARRARLADYPDGVRFCDLSLLPDDSSLGAHLATAVGASIPPGHDVRRELIGMLHEARLLLVLDNCDWLRTPVAQLLDEILTMASGLRVLATSRAPLAVGGEQVVQVHPLGWTEPGHLDRDDGTAADPAVRMLADRARAAGAVVAEGDEALAEVARRVDGIPLAIELVAPRLAAIPAEVVAGRLDRLFDAPAVGPIPTSDGPARQRTLHSTIDWTFGLLSAEAQRLLGGLSVFSGGWTIDAAEDLAEPCGVDRSRVTALLAELSEQSMIRLLAGISPTRYTMLVTIRVYAAGVLAHSGLADAVADRHAAHLLALAEQAVPYRRGPDEALWVGRLVDEHDNLRAAYRWFRRAGRHVDALRLVTALADDIVMREQPELTRWAEELVAVPEVNDDPRGAVALALAANAALMEGRVHDAWQLSVDSLEVERRTGAAPYWMARNVQALVIAIGEAEGDWRTQVETILTIGETTGDTLAVAVAHYTRVVLPALAGHPEEGRDHADALVALGERTRNPTILAMGLLTHGISIADADPPDALADLHQALELATAAQNTLVAHQTLRAIQELDARTGDPASALASLRRMARTFERSRNLVEQAKTILTMLEPLVACGALVPAATICGALSGTHWRLTAAYQVTDHKLSTTLPPDEHLRARRTGALMSPADLVAYVAALVDELAPDEGKGGATAAGPTGPRSGRREREPRGPGASAGRPGRP